MSYGRNLVAVVSIAVLLSGIAFFIYQQATFTDVLEQILTGYRL